MAIKFGDAVLYFKGDQSQLEKDMDKAEGTSKSWLESMKEGVFQGIGQAVFGLVSNGINLVVNGMGSLISGAMDAEKVQAQLNAVLESTGGVAGVTAEMANDLATSLQNVTTFEDDAILSGENLLLTFTGIGKDIFPQATETMLDMSTAMGQDLKSSATMLGKALNDPVAGMSALTKVGVVFTEEQKAMIEQMAAAGDVTGAQKVILEELNREFGGSAKAMGETMPGKIDILKNQLMDLGEGAMMNLLSVLSPLIDMFIGAAENAMPALEAAVANIIPYVQLFADWLGVNLPIAFEAVSAWWTGTLQPVLLQLWTWLQTNIPIAVQTLTDFWNNTLYPALLNFFTWLQVNVFPVITILWNWLMANLPGAIQVLTDYWNLVLYPAILAVWEWIQSTLVPMLENLFTWLQENLPGALETLGNFWTNTLYPAILAVWTWFSTSLLPMLNTLWTWLGTTLTAALQSLSNYWTLTLKPALETVWQWITDNLVPLFEAINELFNVGSTLALTALAGLWEKTLKPALETVANYLSDTLQPVFQALIDFWNNTLSPMIETVRAWFGDVLAGAFGGVSTAISNIIDWVNKMIEALNNVELPDWMTPGSPTPWEIGLKGVAAAMQQLNNTSLPTLEANLSQLQTATAPGAGNMDQSQTHNYYLYPRDEQRDSLRNYVRMLQTMQEVA